MADRYTETEVREQIAAVVALKDQHWSHSRIAEHLGISKSTVHERAGQGALAEERRDVGQANVVRRAATADLTRWAQENREAYAKSDRTVQDVHRATLSAVRIWDSLTRIWGAALPIRVAIGPDLGDAPSVDPVMTEAIHNALGRLCLSPEDCGRDDGPCPAVAGTGRCRAGSEAEHQPERHPFLAADPTYR